MRRSLLVAVWMCCSIALWAQKPMSMKIKDPVICYAGTEDHRHDVAPPQAYFAKKKGSAASLTNATVIEVTYIGFEAVPQAQAAFQKAVDIWASLLITPVPIRIEARWVPLASNVLGSANYTAAYANFKGAQRLNAFYPVAIAEKITGQNLNGTDPDIFANFNSNFNWHFDPDDPNIPSGKYDLTTVVLHEIGHGLGFSGTFTSSSGQGSFGLLGSGVPIVYDSHLQNGSGSNLIATVASPSTALNTNLTGGSLFFNGHSGISKLYAPGTFSAGSSVSHLDEVTFNGTANALMTPQIASQERIRDPGISLEILKDIGWEMVYINHTKLPDNENVNGPYTVTANVTADNGFDPAELKLNYTVDGTNYTSVVMADQGSNNFSANIVNPNPGVARDFGYFISAKSTAGASYTNPGTIVRILNSQLQNRYVFSTGPDTEAPIITHTPELYVLNSETQLKIEAIISDNIGSLTAKLTYSINDVAQPDLPLVLSDPGEDSVYTATINFSGLDNGDKIKYRIVATDASTNQNQKISPATDSHIVPIIGFEPAQTSYQTTFADTERDQEFFGTGFTISTPTGFSNRSLNSEHPYVTGANFPGNERNLIYQLRIPIIVQATAATIKFDEIALVEPGASGSVFGDDDFFDYVIVEGSDDMGETWVQLIPGYDARTQSVWLTRYNSETDGDGNSTALATPELYRIREINMLQKFESGTEIIIRFRMYIDQLAVGWGWTIDNLAIQTVITGAEDALEAKLSVYPNPVTENIRVEVASASKADFSIELLSLQGQKIYEASDRAANGRMVHTIAAGQLAEGMYLIRVSDGTKSTVRKIIKRG